MKPCPKTQAKRSPRKFRKIPKRTCEKDRGTPRSLTIAAGLGPQHRHLSINDAGISWNYTTWLNIAFIVIGLTLLAVFFRSGSGNMLEMMGGSSDSGHDHTVGDHTAD